MNIELTDAARAMIQSQQDVERMLEHVGTLSKACRRCLDIVEKHISTDRRTKNRSEILKLILETRQEVQRIEDEARQLALPFLPPYSKEGG